MKFWKTNPASFYFTLYVMTPVLTIHELYLEQKCISRQQFLTIHSTSHHELGLQVAYSNDASMHKYLRKVLSLPYIPAEHIEEQFLRLCRKANGSQVTDRLLNYVRNTWINSTVWPPSAWSVFGGSIRTSNDVEGWHHRLNKKARKGQLSFYLLVQLLHKEAKLVPLQVRFLSDGKVLRKQRVKYIKQHGCLVKLWEEHREGQRSVK